MIKLKSFHFILIFLSLFINPVNANDKVSYIDIDFLLSNTLVGKTLLNTLKKEEQLKIDKFKSNDLKFKKKKNKYWQKKI